MSEIDKRRKEAEWADENQLAWAYRGYLVTRTPEYSHLYRVLNEDGSEVEGGMFSQYTERPRAFEAIDNHIANATVSKARSE